jgi:acetyltransferase
VPTDAQRNGERIRVNDDTTLLLRPIRPGDTAALVRAFDRLTPTQIRSRLFHVLTELPVTVAQAMCEPDADTTIAFVLTDLDGIEIRGEGRVHLDPVTLGAEFALAIDPAFTRLGLGRILLTRLIDASRARGMCEIWGDAQSDNASMLKLARGLGFQLQREPEDAGLVRLCLPLGDESVCEQVVHAA